MLISFAVVDEDDGDLSIITADCIWECIGGSDGGGGGAAKLGTAAVVYAVLD